MTMIQPQRISDAAFAAYGTVARLPGTAPLAETDQFSFWSDTAAFAVEGEAEIGYCTVRRLPEAEVAWMERHARTPELLVPIDGAFLLPVMAGEKVEVFRVEPGEAVVIGQNVWHSACLPARGDAATYFVIFRRGTPQEDVEKCDIEPVTVDMDQERPEAP